MDRKLKIVRLELKYCEACGALWLRPHTSAAPYCWRCEKIMAGLSRTTRRRAKTAKGARA